MDILALLFLLAASGWFWYDSMRVLEIARNFAMQACRESNLQFLDNTVANIGIALVRDPSGHRVLRRSYRFEFSETGNSRLEARLILQGDKIESLFFEPYQIIH